jgi:hypothetical protein
VKTNAAAMLLTVFAQAVIAQLKKFGIGTG